jgi:RNA polymerase sigma-70 factor (ECF subfamily)
VQPHLDDAYRYARWLTGNAEDAQDIVQESCIRAMSGLDRQNGGSTTARAWLIAIVRNTAFTWLARNRPREVLLTDTFDGLEPRDASAEGPALPDARLIAEADASRLQCALEALPAPLREVLVLRELNDMPYRDIADALNIPIGTVMSRLARARAQMVHLLAEDFP